MSSIFDHDTLTIKQEKEWGEILTDLQCSNKYTLAGPGGFAIGVAGEVGSSFLARNLLWSMRPFQILLADLNNRLIMRLQRPFRFYFHELHVFDPDDNYLGRIKRQFTVLRRHYTVEDDRGEVICELFGPLFRPWTFQIMINGQQHGEITKNFSGMLKEMFTTADNFSIHFPQTRNVQAKSLLLGAVFLIDYIHFEKGG